MSYNYSFSAKAFVFGVTVWILILVYAWYTDNIPKTKPDILPSRLDTTIGGMHYAIWTEPRTGDLVVVNISIDSVRNIMFNNQIK